MNHQELPGQIGFDGIAQEDRVYQNAVERVRLAHEVAKGEKLYVAFSGGKDSTVLWGIVCDAARADGIPVGQYAQRHYNITGMDPPELIYHMRENCPDLQWHMYEESFWRLVVRKGPPTRIARWCCAELKERGGMGCVCCTGVRWAESVRRKTTRASFEVFGRRESRMLFNDNDEARRQFEHCVPKSKRMCNPLVDWTDDNIWNYIRDRGLPYCRLYDEGFDRLGCIGCPMAGGGRWKEFSRWPKYKELYIRAFDRMLAYGRLNGKKLTTWQTGQDVFDWWMDDKNMDSPVPGQIEWEEWGQA